jgi:nucleoside-diphosphate-sugar epimerase
MSGGMVLVTGAAGFIGRRLCRALAASRRVRALFRNEVDGPWHEAVRHELGDGAVPGEALAGLDTVYHLAAYTHAVSERDDEAEYVRTNVTGTQSLLEAARGAGVQRVVFFSSVKAMGEGSADPKDGTAPARPTTAYGRTKLEAERRVLALVPEPVILRPALVYGPGVKGNLAGMIAAIEAGRFPPPPRVENRRSMVHVDDVVDAAVRAGSRAEAVGRVYIVTDGGAYSTRDLYELICRALGRRPLAPGVPLFVMRALALAGDAAGSVLRRRAPFDSESYRKLFGSAVYDGSALVRELDFAPRWSLETALPEIVAAWRASQ